MKSFFLSSLLLPLLSLYTQAAPISTSIITKRSTLPTGWTQLQRADANSVVPLRFGLAQSNIENLYSMLLDVSDPVSPNYGRFWTPQQVALSFAPNSSTIASVTTWLQISGISMSRIALSPGLQWISLNASVSEAEQLLNTQFFVFAHVSGVTQTGCISYTLPRQISSLVNIIRPSLSIPGLLSPKLPTGAAYPINQAVGGAQSLATCDQLVTPDCVQALYGINYVPTQTQNNSFGIVEYNPENFFQTDLTSFIQTYAPNQTQTGPTTDILIDGGTLNANDPTLDHGESDLDFEFALALTNPQPLTLLQGSLFDDWTDAFNQPQCPGAASFTINDFIAAASNPNNTCFLKPPNVVSISYGDDELDLTPAEAIQMCNELGKIGMMGTTVLYAAGDHGLLSNSGQCSLNGQLSDQGNTAVPVFPASCPYITAVGATQIAPGATVQDPEQVWNQVQFSSGGGFSTLFSMPSYQSAAVNSFLQNSPPRIGATFNTSGSRAYPDLAANGANYSIVLDGAITPVSGTSASAPVVGSMITLINDARIAAGKGPLGFINPTIYSSNFSGVFNDITVGTSQGCDLTNPASGFSAAPGWDPVSGLGTINFPKLMSQFLALP